MASVTVTLHGALNLYSPEGKRTVQLQLNGPSTTGQLLEALGLPLGILSILLINDRRAETDSPLSDGDLVEAFPYCAGGSEP